MLQQFLDAKPLYYTEIDYTRMPRAYEAVKEHLDLPVTIHLIGTNGKGTTGRFLATALHNQGYKVLHYTSPHILRFNERIWFKGADISDEKLEELHGELLKILPKEFAESLSYFEYTTLLAVLASQECDYLVLEAGLGGEHDATAVFPNVLTLVTPIAYDHEAFLGDTIEAIATTKMSAVKTKAILAKQKESAVYTVATELSEKKRIPFLQVENCLDQEDAVKIQEIAKQNNLAEYLVENLKLSIAALKELGLSYEVKDFSDAKLFGRLSQIAPNVLMDVGHNALAAAAIYESLKNSKYTLVYNSYKDKDYLSILTILQPIIQEVLIIDVDDQRIETKENLISVLENLKLPHKPFYKVENDQNYLVFGSFSVAEAFLKVYRG